METQLLQEILDELRRLNENVARLTERFAPKPAYEGGERERVGDEDEDDFFC